MINIILINWNKYEVTNTCLKTLGNLKYKKYRLWIIDNGSTNDSVKQICNYFKSELKKYIVLSEDDLDSLSDMSELPRIVIIENRNNYGFAGGINKVLRLKLLHKDNEYIWLINNDIEVEKYTLTALLTKCHKGYDIVGSTVIYHHNKNTIQVLGGSYLYRLFGISKGIMKGCDISILSSVSEERVESQLTYVEGASFFFKGSLLTKVGLFDALFFFYSEECDFCLRAKKLGYKLGYARRSVIYHRESYSAVPRSAFYFYNLSRSRVILYRKHYLGFVPFVIFSTFIQTFIKGQSFMALRSFGEGVFSGLKAKLK